MIGIMNLSNSGSSTNTCVLGVQDFQLNLKISIMAGKHSSKTLVSSTDVIGLMGIFNSYFKCKVISYPLFFDLVP